MQDYFEVKVVSGSNCTRLVCYDCNLSIEEDIKECPRCKRPLERCSQDLLDIIQPLGFPEVLHVDVSRAVSTTLPAGVVKSLLLHAKVLPMVFP